MNNPVNHGETITYTTDYNYYQSIRQNQCNKRSSMESTDTVSFMLVNATTHKIARYGFLMTSHFFKTNEFKMKTEINEISSIKLETPHLKDNTDWSMCRS